MFESVYPLFHFMEKAQKIPMQTPAQLDRLVGKAVNLLHSQLRAREFAAYGSTAACAKINCQHV
jgi:hypothetical protein